MSIYINLHIKNGLQIFYFVFKYPIIHLLCHLLIHKHFCPSGVAMDGEDIKTSKRRRCWKIICAQPNLFCPQVCFSVFSKQCVFIYPCFFVFPLTSYKECEQCGDASSILCRPSQAVEVDPFCKYHTVAFYVYLKIWLISLLLVHFVKLFKFSMKVAALLYTLLCSFCTMKKGERW